MSLSKLSDKHPHPIWMGVSPRNSCLGVQHGDMLYICYFCQDGTQVRPIMKFEPNYYPIQHSHPFVTFPNFHGSLVTDCINNLGSTVSIKKIACVNLLECWNISHILF